MITSFRPSAAERLLGLFFPPRCLLCDQVVPVGQLFCPPCRARLPEDFRRRSLTLEDGGILPVASVLVYEEGFRKTLHQLKFRGQKGLARPIALLMAQAAGTYEETFTSASDRGRPSFAAVYFASRRLWSKPLLRRSPGYMDT